jgi:hypothetical protein
MIQVVAKVQRQARLRAGRQDSRYALESPIPLYPNDVANPTTANIQLTAWGADISHHGIGLIASQSLPPNQLLWAAFDELGTSQLFQIRILRSTKLGDGLFHIAATFTANDAESLAA